MSWDPDACFTPSLSEYLTTHLVTLAAFSTQTCITRNGRNEICSFSCTPQSGQRCEQHRKNVISNKLRFLSHLVHQGLPSLSHSLPRFLLSLCVSHSLSSLRSALPLGPAAFSLIHWRDFLSGQYREGPGGGLGLWRDRDSEGGCSQASTLF